ncbi:MAG: galactose mutarotase, partial [Gammaproteobacteria bacterium]
MNVTETIFGKTDQDSPVLCYHCDNGNGLSVSLIPFGATLVQVHTPDQFDHSGPVTLGFPNLSGYLGPHPSFGSTVGRFCNRIAGAAFTLDGIQHVLSMNEGKHHLHGGIRGLGRQMWHAEPFTRINQNQTAELGVVFSIHSPPGDMGYPGELTARTTYTVSSDNTMRIQFWAQTDATTHVNFTNHAYWNLALEQEKTVGNHTLELAATHRLEVDEDAIPTGHFLPTAGTVFDFSNPQQLDLKFRSLRDQNLTGFDDCYANPLIKHLPPKAILKSTLSGRCLSVSSSQPGLQLYTSQFLSGQPCDGGFGPFSGICLEPQHYPNTPNIDHFPSTKLIPGKDYQEEILYQFWV